MENLSCQDLGDRFVNNISRDTDKIIKPYCFLHDYYYFCNRQ